MRRGLSRLTLLGLLGVLLGLVPLPLAQADCVGPQLGIGDAVDDARPPESGMLPAPGTDVTVSGVWFHTGCDDGGQGGCVAASTEAPMLDEDLVLKQGDSSWVLGTASASSREDSYAIRWQAEVPPDAQAGPATLQAGGVQLRVEISDAP